MKTFVILAAGRGTRIGRTGEYLHKALVPLGGKAVLSHLLDLVPPGADVVVCTGHRHQQIEDYLRIAHPSRTVRTVYVDDWDAPGVGGPGWSLLAAKPYVKGDLIFTSCDTLWAPHEWGVHSWLGVAPLPLGTPPERWCRVIPTEDHGIIVADKTTTPDGGWVHTGMGQIAEWDLTEFWEGLSQGGAVRGEKQMSAGFGNVAEIACVPIDWTDVGDAEAYHRAVELRDGYDWSKTNEATYLLPEEGRVVKFHSGPTTAWNYQWRATQLAGAVPPVLDVANNWTAIAYVHGRPTPPKMELVLDWAENNLWRQLNTGSVSATESFYRGKVHQRVETLPAALRERTYQALRLVDWPALYAGVVPSTMHGDLTFGNMLWTLNGLVAFDWRPAPTTWGDKRYDLAKLWSGCRVDWNTARRGDFRPPARGPADEAVLADYCTRNGITGVPVIAGLCLLSSAPLHPAPFDEILVTRGVKLLEEFACA